MKAIVFKEYGDVDALRWEEVKKPIPKDNEVLIKVNASSINDWDWQLLQGIPFINRLFFGLFKPKKVNILGCDVAGTIEAIGKNVTGFNVGDEVFGDLCESGFGSFAEYVCASEKAILLKPTNMTFEQAAAIPQAGVIALSSLSQKKPIEKGQKILINGASGGSGTLTIQMAKHFGAEITGVCSTSKKDLIRALGVDHVIDYTEEDFTKSKHLYDLIIDVKGYHSIFDYKRVLAPGGIYVMQGGASKLVNQVLTLGPLISLFTNKKISLLRLRPNKNLDLLVNYFNEGIIKPVIDKCFPLSETAKAMEYYGAKKARGKVIITVEENT